MIQNLSIDAVELLSGKDLKQLPADIKGLVNASILVLALADEACFKGFSEFEILLVNRRELIFADYGGKRPRVPYLGIA